MRYLWLSEGSVLNVGEDFGQVKEGQLDVRFWPVKEG